ncbi:MAG: efflux RND transporter periplasmic adaptor subunit [Deltaproteobacteria bacterium]|nr:efflux RND transporter periplasmic adaptor subunit [Deltaproteobacteria bacterium]
MRGFRDIHFYPFVVAVVISSVGCSGDVEKKGAAPATERVMQVKTASIEAHRSERSVQAIGSIYPFDEATVSSETAGTVDKMLADLGDVVEDGDVLAVLDDREARLNLAEAEAARNTAIKTVEKEEASLKRYEQLFKIGMTSEREHDVAIASASEAQARLKQTEARAQLMKKRLHDTMIAAPISGVIRKRHVSKGESVRDKAILFTIVSKGRVKFRGTVAEKAAPDIKKGLRVRITVDAFKDRRFGATLERVSPSVDIDTRTLEVEAISPNEDGSLKPGYFAKAAIITDDKASAVFAPEAAVYSSAGVVKVFVIRGAVAQEKLVKIIPRQAASGAPGMIEIIGDVKAGETVAISNLSNLYDGAPVSVEKKVEDGSRSTLNRL